MSEAVVIILNEVGAEALMCMVCCSFFTDVSHTMAIVEGGIAPCYRAVTNSKKKKKNESIFNFIISHPNILSLTDSFVAKHRLNHNDS